MLIAIAVVAGLLIGSFLNVCIYRWTRNPPRSVVRPRSFCPKCKTTIAWYDNVPLLSYGLLHGRCRHCGARISWRYPLVELLTAALFAVAVARFGPTLAAVKICVFSAALLGLIFSDFERRLLPDEFTLGGLLLGLVFAALVPFPFSIMDLFVPSTWGRPAISVVESAFSAVFGAGMVWAIGSMWSRVRGVSALGLGDVKMIAMIGAFAGLQTSLLVLAAGSLLGILIGPLWAKARGKKRVMRFRIPYGTFLGIAGVVLAMLGPK